MKQGLMNIYKTLFTVKSYDIRMQCVIFHVAQTSLALAEEKVNLIATVPSHKKLQIRTVRDIANALDAKIVYNQRSALIG